MVLFSRARRKDEAVDASPVVDVGTGKQGDRTSKKPSPVKMKTAGPPRSPKQRRTKLRATSPPSSERRAINPTIAWASFRIRDTDAGTDSTSRSTISSKKQHRGSPQMTPPVVEKKNRGYTHCYQGGGRNVVGGFEPPLDERETQMEDGFRSSEDDPAREEASSSSSYFPPRCFLKDEKTNDEDEEKAVRFQMEKKKGEKESTTSSFGYDNMLSPTFSSDGGYLLLDAEGELIRCGDEMVDQGFNYVSAFRGCDIVDVPSNDEAEDDTKEIWSARRRSRRWKKRSKSPSKNGHWWTDYSCTG
jgi:hypothetical protein